MTFEEILDQAIAMLQRRGRLTYGALKRQFQLDDAYLDDLKAELIEGQRVAVDEDGRVLVWTGHVAGTIATSAPRPQSIPAPLSQDIPSVEPASPVVTSRTPEAERRQLTVMFCDLVDSTRLSSQLDPEDWRDVVRAYQRACAEIIQRYDGHIAQLLGDGLLVYFGYPQAHEDDAQRAVRAGLGMLAALGDLNQGLQQAQGIQLAIRVGIHTGLVVVGEMGGEGRYEHLALGEVPNVCSRIQGLAAPNTIAMSAATYRLVQGYFVCQALGAQALRGVAEPITVYQVLSERGVYSRLDIASARGLTPLVGREQEVGLLLERWTQVKDRHGQVVLLTGEAGIGKSRLVQMLKDHVAQEPHTRWECRSVEYSQNSSLYPMIDLFQRLLRFQAEETPQEKVEKLEQTLRRYRLPLEETVPLFAPLLTLPLPENRYPPLNLSPQRQRQKMLETVVAMLLELAERQPVLFIVEDLHWTDPTTLELIGLLLDQTPTASLLVLLTCRPHFQPAWPHRSYLTEMTLNRLSHAQVEQIVAGITDGKTLPKEVLQQILAKTDGVPLFVEELTKAIVESGHLQDVKGHYELTGSFSTFAIPATLQDSLMARLDRLVTAKGIAQLAAIIGRQFPYELLHAIAPLDEAMLQHELGRLVEAEIVYQRGLPPQATYTFKHALIQDAAYASLLKSARQQYHQRIAQALEAQFPVTAETEPALLAHHWTEAGLNAQAVQYWLKAGQHAIQRSVYGEAIVHLTKGLAQLETLLETSARLAQELDLQMTLGRVLEVVQGNGHVDVGNAYTRAWVLCQQVGTPFQTTQSLWGLSTFHYIRRELRTAYARGTQCLAAAQCPHDAEGLIGAQQTLGLISLALGEFVASRAYLEQGIALYHPRQHATLVTRYTNDLGLLCYNCLTQTLWVLGYPTQALVHRREMVALAQALAHPYSLGLTLYWAVRLHRFRREEEAMLALLDAFMPLAAEQAFTSLSALGRIMRGWALIARGQVAAGLSDMREGITHRHAIGVSTVLDLAFFAEATAKAGQVDEGLRMVEEAFTLVDSTAEHWYDPELYRLKGELLLQQSSDRQAEVERCFHHALDIACRQQAKSFELRTATSLARLWHQQGKRQEAHDLLAPVYHWFTEGFDTADLQEAKTLLDALA